MRASLGCNTLLGLRGGRGLVMRDLEFRFGLNWTLSTETPLQIPQNLPLLNIGASSGGVLSHLEVLHQRFQFHGVPVVVIIELANVVPLGHKRSKGALRLKLHAYVTWLEEWAPKFHPDSSFVFGLYPQVHEYSWHHLTMPRTQAYSVLAAQVLQGFRWQLVDADAVTAGRPNFRGVHALSYANKTGGVTYTLSNLALNIACNRGQ